MKTQAAAIASPSAFSCDLCGARLDEAHLDFAADGSHCTFCGASAQPHDPWPANAVTSLDVGDSLHDARLTRGETLEQAARFTRIQLPYLRALELDDASVFEPFPGMTYARYFLRDYAEHLGVDPAPLVRRFDSEVTAPVIEPVGRASVLPGPPHPRRWAVGALAVLMTLLIGSAVWSQRSAIEGSTAAQSPASGRDRFFATGPVGARGTVDLSQLGFANSIAVVVRTQGGPSWILATVDGNVVSQETVPSGQVRRWRATDTLSLRLGNAGAVGVMVNGQRVRTGSQGAVVDLRFRIRDGQVVEY